MKKILLVFDGCNFSEGAFEFAHQLNELKPILLTGVFLPQAELSYFWSYAGASPVPLVPLVEGSDSELVLKNIEHFEKLCRSYGIDYKVHKDYFDLVLPALKKESRYADLLILGSESFYETVEAGAPNVNLREALHDVSCPVLLVPEKFDFPKSTILAYDGSEDAVYAIKQFAYLFPELVNRKTLLVYANDKEESNIPDYTEMQELATRHFTNITLFKLNLDHKKYFSSWILEKGSSLLVSGSYGRSGISQLFKKSFVRDVISEHRLPVFIAHR